MKNVYLGIALLATSAMANASVTAVLDSVTPAGANSGFNYEADLTADESLNPAATSGVTCPTPNAHACNGDATHRPALVSVV